VVWSALFGWSVANTIYADHENLASDVGQLTKDNRRLQDTLQTNTNNLDLRDPVTGNLIYLLQAFRSYRGALRGAGGKSAELRLATIWTRSDVEQRVSQTEKSQHDEVAE
jgi:hypothetical protein